MATINYSTSDDLFTKPVAFEFGIKYNTLVHQSPLTGYVQTVGLTGARWTASITYPTLSLADGAKMDAFIASLKGQQNRLALYNLARQDILGAGTGSPVVSGAGQTGSSINTGGWGSNQVVLKAGDMIGIGGELKMVLADVTSNGSGAATITFEPALRASPSNGSAIDITKPTALFILTENEIRTRRLQDHFEGITLDFVEVFA